MTNGILREILSERERQDEQWGSTASRNLPLTVYFVVLGEEVGEVAEAILKHSYPEKLRKELIQVAAVAVAMIEALEAGTPNGVDEKDAG